MKKMKKRKLFSHYEQADLLLLVNRLIIDLIKHNQANISHVSEQICQQHKKCIGHILKMNANQHPKTTLTCSPEGKRRRGRPRETWHRTTGKKGQLWVLHHGAGQQ